MNIVLAANAMKDLVALSLLPAQHSEYGKDHMIEMINKINDF